MALDSEISNELSHDTTITLHYVHPDEGQHIEQQEHVMSGLSPPQSVHKSERSCLRNSHTPSDTVPEMELPSKPRPPTQNKYQEKTDMSGTLKKHHKFLRWTYEVKSAVPAQLEAYCSAGCQKHTAAASSSRSQHMMESHRSTHFHPKRVLLQLRNFENELDKICRRQRMSLSCLHPELTQFAQGAHCRRNGSPQSIIREI